MATLNAPKNLAELETLLKDDIKVKVAGVDADGVLRGKYMSKKKFLSAAKGGFGFCSVIFGWDLHDSVYPRELLISNKENGYHDLHAEVDLASFRRLPYENDCPLFLITYLDPDTKVAIPPCPRGMLRRVLDRIGSADGKVGGFKGLAGVEFEYFQFKETPDTLAQKKGVNLTALTPGMHGYSMLRPLLNNAYFHDLHDKAEQFGIEVEGHHTETGPGVFETALGYTTALRMADNAVLFKLLAKTAGIEHGVMPTFMAKPYASLPGCSGHIHVSLQTTEGKNAFAYTGGEAGGRPGAAFKDVAFLSEIGEQFLAGVVRGLPDVMPLLCPNINSYKRLTGGEAFWAPNLASWGYDSRAASVRILGPPGAPSEGTRFEIRVPGADINPYYALSAIFALGQRGIEQKLTLPYGPVGHPDVSPADIPKLATDLRNATERFGAKGSIAREVLGDDFVDHFKGTREHEWDLWQTAVTSYEVERYFELA